MQRYTTDIRELGDIVRVGDAIACNQLLQIALVMQRELIKSLQLAMKYDNAILNLKILHEASIVNRNDTIVTLDEMKKRILITRPIRTLPSPPNDNRDTRASLESVQAYRPARLDPVPDDYVPAAVTIPVQDDSRGSGLTRLFSARRHSNQTSTPQSPHSASATTNSFHSPARQVVLQEHPNNPAIIMDIDEMITSLQGWNTGGNRRDTWDVLNGGQGGRVHSNRDTLAILNGDNHRRDTKDLNQQALHQLLGTLPPTPEEPQGSTTYPGFNRNIFGQQSHNQHQYTQEPAPLPQRQPSTESRWSNASSRYSDTQPPSLYSHGSHSSRRSSTPPISGDFSPSSSSAPVQPLNTYQYSDYIPPLAAHGSQFPPSTVPQPPPNPPFAVPIRTRTPPVNQDKNGFTSGRTRVHLVPDHAAPSALFSPAPIRHGIPALVSSTASTLAAPAAPQPPIKPLQPHSRTNSGIGKYTIQGPVASQEAMMSGRPCKDNEYWGFCKGAWGVREEIKKGLGVQTRPDGLYNTHSIWQCKHCNFQGETFTGPHPVKKGKTETIVDPNIYTSAVGIRYKWIFLAKSHVKKKTMEMGRNNRVKNNEKDDCNYGCVICSVEGNVTGIYGNVETLMNHIFLEHARGATANPKTLSKSKCIIGRTATSTEDWDINIPSTDMLSG